MDIKKLLNWVFKIFMFVTGFVLGYLVSIALMRADIINIKNTTMSFVIKIIISLIFAIIFYSFSGTLRNNLKKLLSQIESDLSKRPLYEVIFSSLGLIFGLIIAFLFSQLINSFNFPYVGGFLSLLVYIIFGYLGISIASKNKEYLLSLAKETQLAQKSRKSNEAENAKYKKSQKKVLDTSAIIDGRILEIAKTGFLEGQILVPVFVLEELQHIADSSDALKRNRGRRGLDVINKIQELDTVKIVIVSELYEEIPEVDAKIVKLALDSNAKIITNDFNLNKVAEVQGVAVLNINELANALKPIAIPGEKMTVQIIKEGQEPNQGVAYLDDGTMIVVKNGKKNIGETVEVIVTSVLQTNAGKMIFAKVD